MFPPKLERNGFQILFIYLTKYQDCFITVRSKRVSFGLKTRSVSQKWQVLSKNNQDNLENCRNKNTETKTPKQNVMTISH